MKKKILFYSIFYFVIIGLFLLGTFCDLSISKALADLDSGAYFSKNLFANVVECFAEWPIYFLLSASLCVVGYSLTDKFQKQKLIIIIIVALGVFFAFALCFYRCVVSLGEVYGFYEQLEDNLAFYICCLLCGIAFAVVFIWLSNLIGTEKLSQFFYFAIACIAVIAITFLLTQILKEIVNRPRFRALNVIGFDKYSPWYKVGKINGKDYTDAILADDGFVSFPSGHVSWSANAIMLCFLPRFINLNKKAKLCFTIIPPCVTILVAFARIVAGAHYLTDVTFSLLASVIVMELAVLIVLLIKKKRDKKLQEQLLVKD